MRYTAWATSSPNADFQQVEQEIAVLKPKQVLVRIAAAGVNPLDTKIRKGQAAHAQQPLPAVLCLDMAGTVVEVGAEVTHFKAGDAVYGMVGGVGGRQGTLAEYIAVEEDLLAFKPAQLSFAEAAAMPLITITAWEAVYDRAKVRADQSVLVHGGAGGVGHIEIQLAKARGAKVFATTKIEKRGIVEGFGATAIDHISSSVEQYLDEHTGGEGFDIVLDNIGGQTLDASFIAAKRYTGHVVSILGWGSHSLAPLSFRGATYSGVFTLYPLLTGIGLAHHGEVLRQAASLVDQGQLKPLMADQIFTTSSIAEAFSAIENGITGKVVVVIGAKHPEVAQ